MLEIPRTSCSYLGHCYTITMCSCVHVTYEDDGSDESVEIRSASWYRNNWYLRLMGQKRDDMRLHMSNAIIIVN